MMTMAKVSNLLLLSTLAAIGFGTPAAATPCDKADVRCAQLVQWALVYPFINDRQANSYLLVSGGVYPFVSFEQDQGSATVMVPGETQAIPVSRLLKLLKEPANNQKRTPVIAYGSNPALWVLADKFTRLYGENKEYKGSMVIPVTNAILRDYDVTWLARFTGAGGLPAAISAAPGTEVEVWLTWLDADQLAWMNASKETSEPNGMDSLNRMPKHHLRTTGYALDRDPLVYVSCHGALAYTASLLSFNGTGFELIANTIATLHQDAILQKRNAILKAHAIASPKLTLEGTQYACKPLKRASGGCLLSPPRSAAASNSSNAPRTTMPTGDQCRKKRSPESAAGCWRPRK